MRLNFWSRVGFGSLILAIIIGNAVWIRLDTRPQPFNDPYVEKTFVFATRAAGSGAGELPGLLEDLSVWPRPPFYQLMTVPFVRALGRSPDTMLIVNLLGLLVLAASTYKIAELSMNRRAGWLAALIVVTYPPILNLAKIARTHAIVPAAVALTIALLLLAYRSRSPRHAWMFGASLGGAFLLHPNTFYALPVPAAVVGLYMALWQRHPGCPEPAGLSGADIQRRLLDPFVRKGLIPAAAITVAVAALWYAPNLRAVAWLVKDSAANWSTARYGFEDVAPSFWWYARTSVGALSTFFAGLLVLGCASLLFFRTRVETSAVAIVALFAGCTYVGFALREGSSAWMNFALALPLAAVLTAVGVQALAEWIAPTDGPGHTTPTPLKRGLRNVLLSGCVGMAILNYTIVDWGIPGGEALAQRLGSPRGETCRARMNVSFCANPPLGGRWPTSDMLRTVLDDAECGERTCTLVIAANWRDGFSYSHLRYQFAQDFPDAEMNIQRVVDYRPAIDWLTGDYVVYLKGWDGDGYQNAIAAFLDAPPEPYRDLFTEVGLFPLPTGQTARLVRRTRPIGIEDMVTLIGRLGLPQDLEDQLEALAIEGETPGTGGS